MSWGWHYYDRRSAPEVKGGIKAQSKRGSFGQTWWARRWNETLDEYDMGERMARGRTYARKGQVAELKVGKGSVTARVQGSYGMYRVTIGIRTLSKAQWGTIAGKMLDRPATIARLLSGSMPEDMEDIFRISKLRLLPSTQDLRTDCTCPDWENPCKHIAAVYLLLAEEFDRDPFMIFRLRGIERGELLEIAGLWTGTGERGGKRSRGGGRKGPGAKPARPKPIPADPAKFWGSDRPGGDPGDAAVPNVPAALVKQLGSFPFWRGKDNFLSAMEEIYRGASEAGAKAVLGETPSE